MRHIPRLFSWTVRAFATCLVIVWLWILVMHGKSFDSFMIDHLRPVAMGSIINFGDDAHVYFKGFSPPEKAFRWSARKDAALIFKINFAGTAPFDVCAQGLLLAGVEIKAKIDGTKVPVSVDASPLRYCLTVPGSPRAAQVVRIDLHFSGVHRTVRDRDTRTFGFALKSVSLKARAQP